MERLELRIEGLASRLERLESRAAEPACVAPAAVAPRPTPEGSPRP